MSGTLLAVTVAFVAFLSGPSLPPSPHTSAAVSTTGIAEPVGPARGLGLVSTRTPQQHRSPIDLPLVPVGGLGIGGTLAAGSLLARRRRVGGGAVSQGPVFVYVPGHGGDPGGFDYLATRMGIDTKDIRIFDYRWAWPNPDAVEASRRATTDDAADALGAYLAALGSDGRPIYLVGHSKGGAVITEVVSRWDAVPGLGVDAVIGAAILDPPISSGPLGLLQSLGWLHGETADDGLFSPVRCGWTGCRDVRDRLGERSGVEVVIVRNPDAAFTNFRDQPDRVRVYDLDDRGGSMQSRFPDVLGMWQRMGEAHDSVLRSDTVADCIQAEARSVGSCSWPSPEPHRMSGGAQR